MTNALTNILQAGSNIAAENLSMPVDGIAWLLRKAGVPVPQNALMGSDWMAEKGLTAPVQPGVGQLAGETFGLLGPMGVAAAAPQIARGLLKGGENLAARQTLNPQTGAIDIQALKAAFPDLDVSLRQTRDIAMLDKVAVPAGARNQGRGTEFMQALTRAADDDGARIGLTASNEFGSAKGRLEDFYKRFGFQANKGRNKDLELMAGMVRQPSGKPSGLLGASDNALQTPTSAKVQGVDEYAGLHRPPMSDSGAPLHDLTGGGKVYPDDVYSSNAARYYGAGNPQDDAALFYKIHALKGKPDEIVDIFRAVPKEAFVGGRQPPFNHGDWVTISRKYAVEHGEGALNGDYKIMRARVPAKALFTNGDSPYEFGLDRIAGGIER